MYEYWSFHCAMHEDRVCAACVFAHAALFESGLKWMYHWWTLLYATGMSALQNHGFACSVFLFLFFFLWKLLKLKAPSMNTFVLHQNQGYELSAETWLCADIAHALFSLKAAENGRTISATPESRPRVLCRTMVISWKVCCKLLMGQRVYIYIYPMSYREPDYPGGPVVNFCWGRQSRIYILSAIRNQIAVAITPHWHQKWIGVNIGRFVPCVVERIPFSSAGYSVWW